MGCPLGDPEQVHPSVDKTNSNFHGEVLSFVKGSRLPSLSQKGSFWGYSKGTLN